MQRVAFHSIVHIIKDNDHVEETCSIVEIKYAHLSKGNGWVPGVHCLTCSALIESAAKHVVSECRPFILNEEDV